MHALNIKNFVIHKGNVRIYKGGQAMIIPHVVSIISLISYWVIRKNEKLSEVHHSHYLSCESYFHYEERLIFYLGCAGFFFPAHARNNQ